MNNYLSQLAKQPDIIALSETKLRDGCILGNINLHGYKFNYVNSLTNAGRVGLYIKDRFHFSVNANVQCELSVAKTLWIDIMLNNSSVVTAVAYRHPGPGVGDISRFNDSMQKMLDTVNKKKRSFYIMGDFNIDLLKISNNETIRQYANTLLGSMCKCLIDLPTRVTPISKTLIDHIYSNDTKSRINSGILVTDISDHFPVFAIISKIKLLSNKLVHYYVRDMNKFDHKIFLEQLNYRLDIVHNASIESVHEQFSQFISTFFEVIDAHVPLRKATRKEKRLKLKPRITRGILKSISIKNKLFRLAHKENDRSNLIKYKTYRNALNRTIKEAKRNYYQDFLTQNKNNAKKIWEATNDLVNQKNKTASAPNTLKKENGEVATNSKEIAEEFNNFFVNIGNSMAKFIPPVDYTFPPITSCSGLSNSVFLEPFTPNEVNEVIRALNDRKARRQLDPETRKSSDLSLFESTL